MSKQTDTIEHRGFQARVDGKLRTRCPYADVRGARGHVTGARAARNAWFRGWDRADATHKKSTSTDSQKDVR